MTVILIPTSDDIDNWFQYIKHFDIHISHAKVSG